jgi:hypothetical protein
VCGSRYELTGGQVAASDGTSVEADDYRNSLPDIDACLNGVGNAALGARAIHIVAGDCHRDLAVSQEAVSPSV